MPEVLLISENKLKAFTSVNKNVDMDVLKAQIMVAQQIGLQTILGTKFYSHLCDQVSSTGNTFNSDELEMVNDYIAPYLIQQAYYEAIPFIHLRTMNVGIVQAEGLEGGRTGADVDTMKYLRSIQKQRADFYRERLQDYLQIGNGQGKFPDYLSQTNTDGMMPDKGQGYGSPIVLNRVTRKGYNMIGGNIPIYSENDKINPPCYGCQ